MGKISPVSSKYIVHATIQINGVVDRPDVIGAIFGQTEGLLGSDLELRELQRSGRIGRIEVNIDTKSGKSRGDIIIPSSLDKAETAIVGAALEIIERIGPCNAKIVVEKIEDVRISKRKSVIDRAKELLRLMMDSQIPDSQELADEVASSVRVMEITEFGKGKLPAGPQVEDSDDIIIVEGRADVLTLLRHGFKNAIAIGGTGVPPEINALSKEKTVTIFVDGDRGGDLIIKELLGVAEIDFITKAPDGKEVEELTKKEIHKALRSRVASEQANLELPAISEKNNNSHPEKQFKKPVQQPRSEEKKFDSSIRKPAPIRKPVLTDKEKTTFSTMIEDLVGTRGAYVLDDKLNILGKVPVTELSSTVKSLYSGIHAIIFDGKIDKDLVSVCEKSKVKFLIGMGTDVKPNESQRMAILTSDNL